MTPTHTESPLRRSNMSAFKTPVQTPIINDDEEERRQARRRTILDESTSTASTIEENQTLKDCLKIFADNKLSKDNAWSVSLIDTLSNLLDKHHKSLNNFKVAGSSLEASSKVYGLRVDSVHTDVVRMSAGLYKQKAVETSEPEDVDNNDNANENGPVNEQAQVTSGDGETPQPKPKRRKRKQVSTVTRNEDTINGHLDTHPSSDPIFAKLNSIVGSINSSNRLLQNILPTLNSELKLRMDYNYWDATESKNLVYNEVNDYEEEKVADFKPLEEFKIADSVLRPDQSGYIILDTPADPDDEDPPERFDLSDSENRDQNSNSEMALAFDMNADVPPEPLDTHTFVDVDIDQFDELTQEEQVAINNCKGLRRVPVVIEDMRPVDSTSNLEYSYRPLDKISQFWAGPSHWKFKKSRKTSFSMVQRLTQTEGTTIKQKQRHRKVNRLQPKQVQFGETHDDLFQKLDSKKPKLRKANVQKKWDAKKLRLPTDLQIDENCFDIYDYAPAIRIQEIDNSTSPDLPLESYNYNNPTDQEYCSNVQNDDQYVDDDNDADMHVSNHDSPEAANTSNTTIMEISTDFEGAPDKVIKVVVPFAKRAKVVDMKQLKYCCMNLVKKEMIETEKENFPNPVNYANENYNAGAATFKSIYKKLPKILTPNMADALSTTVAFYSILHLANDNNLRLVQQSDLNDFQIRQLNINNKQ